VEVRLALKQNQKGERIALLAEIVSKCELREVQRQVLSADIVAAVDHAALEQRSERFDAICVDL
jgi:hypothetical protein